MAKKFRIGLTMAGAVSAGAYTGGVLDYLLQVLDAWQAAKSNNDTFVPTHDVSLDIISGASAGGITGAMAVLALCTENRYPVTPCKRTDEAYLKQNVFYDGWVNLQQDDMLPLLLHTSDIEKEEKVVSLLNSEFIEGVANRLIVCLPECATAPPPYVNPSLELILTLTNLAGFQYNLKFTALGASFYTMKQHRDYAFFRLGETYSGDGRIPLHLQKNIGIEALKQAAPATGAFPIGLAYRKFVRKKKYIIDNKDLVIYRKGISELQDFNEDNREEDYVTYNVDGGMLNNEPFDLTMKLMAKVSANTKKAEQEELLKEEKDFDATIIMIDPFPSDDSKSIAAPETVLSTSQKTPGTGGEQMFPKFPYNLLEIIGHIYRSLRGEVLFKGEDIAEAFSRQDFSRFMIAPRRKRKIKVDNKEQTQILNGSIAIASGALDGFAGFFDKSLREHDFYLGRANCQSFLRKHFRVKLADGKPVNALFAAGYSAAAIEHFKFQDEQEQQSYLNPADAPWYVPIIPDVFQKDSAYNEIPLPYPKYNMEQLHQHRAALLKRLRLIGNHTITNTSLKFVFNLWFFFKKRWLFKQLSNRIEKHFKDWELI